jgi:hypothetical protein
LTQILKKLEGSASNCKSADIAAIIAVREGNKEMVIIQIYFSKRSNLQLVALFRQEHCLLDTMRILSEMIETDNSDMLAVVVAENLIDLAKSSMDLIFSILSLAHPKPLME